MRETRRTRDKAERTAHKANLLHQKIAQERSQGPAIAREKHLRDLLGLPAAPARAEIDRERDDK
jgi:hypothetical protein